jgi:hypothetical protein
MHAPAGMRIERVTGPHRGFYIVAFTVESAGAFYGDAKVCLDQPSDVWDCSSAHKVTTPASASRDGAVLVAEQRARDLVRALAQGAEEAASSGDQDRGAPRQNRPMRVRARFPKSPAAWLKAVGFALLLLVAFAMLDGMGCSEYARRGGDAAASENSLYRPAVVIDGRLCSRDGSCSPAVLVQGLLSTDTLAQLRERASKSMPGTLTACFNSPGGSYEAARLADELPSNLRTCVADLVLSPGAQPEHALCASACAWTWMGGTGRVIYGENSVGFHAPYEYDAPACVPGNLLKGLLAATLDWLSDRGERRFDDKVRAARTELRLASLSQGPTEVLPLGAERAVALGLQRIREPAAIFYVGAQPEATTLK